MKKFSRAVILKENASILALILVNLLIGWWVFKDYGESWDERVHFEYAIQSLAAYLGAPSDTALHDKGPFYAMVTHLAGKVLTRLDPGLRPTEVWHLMNFFSFQMGLFFLFRLSRRVASKWAAFGATLLFNTQPLLWGHAFINPKDIPFMAFTLASLELGLWMGETPIVSEGNNRQPRLALWRVILAGAVVGMSTAIRVLGPAAGALAGIYWLVKKGHRAIPILIVYALTALVTAYAVWPGLWGDPVRNFLKAARTAADFPWEGKVLFDGVEYEPGELPRSYLPTLIGLQLTEPALALFALGVIIAAIRVTRKQLDWELIILFAAWLVLPILAAILFRPKLYDNFRQFLFCLPPVFIFGAIGLQSLFGWLRKPVLQAAALAILAAPGIYACIQLHPYQYIYYNSLTGGVSGAFRRFEMDYWLTSYKEASEYLNKNSRLNASVVAWGAPHLVKRYGRDDLDVLNFRRLSGEEAEKATLAVISSRHNKDQWLYSQEPILLQVSREGAILAVVKALQRIQAP